MVHEPYTFLGLNHTGVVETFDPAPNSDEEGFRVTLRTARLKKGLTQETAARLAEIDPGTLARWERYEKEPPSRIRQLDSPNRALDTAER